MEGTVKWFNIKKGYGFITGEDGQEYFVHYSALPQGVFIRDNDKVSFEPADSERGKQAQNVTLLQKGSEIAQEGGEAPAKDNAEAEPAEEKAEASEAPAEESKDSEDF